MTDDNRIHSLDVLRGFAVAGIIFLHSSIYNYANIHKIDFSNPPVYIVLMSFMGLWGGIFIIYSTVVNSLMIAKRSTGDHSPAIFIHLTYAVIIYLIFHYILNIVSGRWNIDFVNNQPDLTLIAGTLRSMRFTLPHATKLFEGSSLSTIALNLLIISWILYFLFRKNGREKHNRNYLILGLSGFIIIIFSFIRIPFYRFFPESIESGNWFLSIIFSYILANPYPLLTYLSYGLSGALIGLMIHDKRSDLLKKIILPAGLLFVIFGISGMMHFPKTISKPDLFWYFKTNFELGLFLLLIPGMFLIFENRDRKLIGLSLLKWFSRICFTIYMLETLMSEMIRLLLNLFIADWNQTITGCLLFGAGNVIIWSFIVFFWSRNNFRYSLEYFWVKIFNRLGKESSKLSS